MGVRDPLIGSMIKSLFLKWKKSKFVSGVLGMQCPGTSAVSFEGCPYISVVSEVWSPREGDQVLAGLAPLKKILTPSGRS